MAIKWKVLGDRPCASREKYGPYMADFAGLRFWMRLSVKSWVLTCDALGIKDRYLDTEDKAIAKQNSLVVMSEVARDKAKHYERIRSEFEKEINNG